MESAFVRNAWYVAGWSTEFGEALTAVEILAQPLVMFRESGGAVRALEDRCPHRLLPLSMGKRIGDTIQCGYHGMTFDGAGRCVRVPGQENTPRSAYARSFPVEERHGVVWVWMGEGEPGPLWDLPQLSDPAWHLHHGGHLHIRSNYLNVAENLVDPAHVSFVHPTTLGSAASENVPVHVSTSGEVISAWRWIRNAPPVGFFQAFGGFEGNVDRWHYYHLHMPSTAVIDFGSIDAGTNDEGEETRDRGVRIFAIHFVTPVREDYTIDHWMHVRNTAPEPEASARMDAMFETAFGEDKAILEAVHASEQRPQPRKPIRIAIDKAPTVYRKRIREALAAEATEDLGAPERPSFIQHD